MNENFLRTWLRAWALITVVDGIFATVLPVVAYGQPLGRAWQNVAAVLLGRTAIYGGARTIVFCVRVRMRTDGSRVTPS